MNPSENNPENLPSLPPQTSPVASRIADALLRRSEAEEARQKQWAESIKPTRYSGGLVRQLGAAPRTDRGVFPNASPGGQPVLGSQLPSGVVVDYMPRTNRGRTEERAKAPKTQSVVLFYVNQVSNQEIFASIPPEDNIFVDTGIYLLLDNKYIQLTPCINKYEWRPLVVPYSGQINFGAFSVTPLSDTDLSYEVSAVGSHESYSEFRYTFPYSMGIKFDSMDIIVDPSGNAGYGNAFVQVISNNPDFSYVAYNIPGANQVSLPATTIFSTNRPPERPPEAVSFRIRHFYFFPSGGGSMAATVETVNSQTIPLVEVLDGWTFISRAGWIAWVVVVEKGISTQYDYRYDENLYGPKYLTEYLYGYSGKTSVTATKVYAKRYYNDGSREYASAATYEELEFGPEEIVLEDFRPNTKSANLKWYFDDPVETGNPCFDDYLSNSYIQYFQNGLATRVPYHLNSNLIAGLPMSLFYWKTSTTDGTCQETESKVFRTLTVKPFDKTEFDIPAETEIHIQVLAGTWYTTKAL